MGRKRELKGSGLGALALILIVLIIAAWAVFRYIGTDRGRIFLLDIGFDSRYGQAQEAVERSIMDALTREGIAASRIEREREKTSGGWFPAVVLRIGVPEGLSLIKINGAVDEAVRSVGARIRSCREGAKGTGMTMEVGTRRTVTHRCIIKTQRTQGEPAHGAPASPEIALIVDDFGYFYNSLVTDFLALEIRMTISVIPGLTHSVKICDLAVARGKEVLCHLPMEPEKGAEDVEDIPLVSTSMSGAVIEQVVGKALASTPGIVGMNNHMGSKATADRRVMKAVLNVCRRSGYFFIDSMTSSKSVVAEVAGEVGVQTLSNDLFIDNRNEDTRENMYKLMSIAERRGRALGILHVRRKSLDHLKWMIGEAERRGIRFVTVSEMIAGHALSQS